ncbi:MAG: DUF1990 family protein [Planctomyces sp.]|jgi:uncharacterized protein (UPF0548 family)
MYLIRKPDSAQIGELLKAQSRLQVTYNFVGLTREGHSPSGFVVDHHRVCLGYGPTVFERSRSALLGFQQFRFSWVELFAPHGEPQEGQSLALLARAAGLWVLNANRILYRMENNDDRRHFGYAYGTLPEHAESGEERFLVEYNPGDDSVWYDIFAFSKPNQWQSRVAYPFVRRCQKRFARDSMNAMTRAVSSAAK